MARRRSQAERPPVGVAHEVAVLGVSLDVPVDERQNGSTAWPAPRAASSAPATSLDPSPCPSNLESISVCTKAISFGRAP